MNDADEQEAVTGDRVAPDGCPSHTSREELDAALAALRELEDQLPQTAREAFDALLAPDGISRSTGIEPDRVAALLGGAEPDGDTSRDASRARIVARLRFPRATRLKERAARRRAPRMCFFAEIASGAHISKQTVRYVFEYLAASPARLGEAGHALWRLRPESDVASCPFTPRGKPCSGEERPPGAAPPSAGSRAVRWPVRPV